MSRLDSFRCAAFSLQAPSGRAALGLAAALVLSGGAPSEDHRRRGGALAPDGHARLVSQVQAALDQELGHGRITVVDRSAAPREELERLAERLPIAARATAALAAIGEGPGPASATLRLVPDEASVWRRPYEVEPGTSCLVAGARPQAVGGEAVGAMPGALHASAAQRWALWREVGHCLIGPSRAAAEAFASLVSHREGDPETPRRLSLLPDADADDPGARARGIAAVAGIAPGIGPDRGIQSLAALADRLAGDVSLLGRELLAGDPGDGAPTFGARVVRTAAAGEAPDPEEPQEDTGPVP